jgi:hypothetical protein
MKYKASYYVTYVGPFRQLPLKCECRSVYGRTPGVMALHPACPVQQACA